MERNALRQPLAGLRLSRLKARGLIVDGRSSTRCRHGVEQEARIETDGRCRSNHGKGASRHSSSGG